MDDILSEIEAFRDAHNLTPAKFGKLAAKDTRLLTDLEKGRELRRKTIEKVRRFMLTYGADKTADQAEAA